MPASSVDLSSLQTAPLPANSQSFSNVNLILGGVTKTVTPIDQLTAAEMVAVNQVLNYGRQNLQLSNIGTATGGRFDHKDLGSLANGGLIIPAGVTAVFNAASQPTFRFTGNLTNAGAIFALSTNSSVAAATISAANIYNQQGGLITSVLPASGIATYAVPSNTLDLHLTATGSIINNGTIGSSRNLQLSATNIVNAQSASIQSNQTLTMEAGTITNFGAVASQNKDIQIGTANLTNQGSIQALSGLITVESATNQLQVSNAGGAITAREIVFRTLNQSGDTNFADLLVQGGLLDSQKVTFLSPNGHVRVDADAITGDVHVIGCTASVGVAGGNLHLREINLSGDPIFYNSGGDLDLALTDGTNSTAGGDYIALASGNITASGVTTGATIDASSGTGNGGQIVIAAGATFTVTGDPNCSACVGNYSITGTSSTGGNINLPLVNLKTNGSIISLQAQASGSSAGSIAIGSLQGGDTSVSGGSVALGDANVSSLTATAQSSNLTLSGVITSSGAVSLSAAHGNVTQSAGSISAPSVSIYLGDGGSQQANLASTLNSISSLSGTGAGGSITLVNGNNPVSLQSFASGQNLDITSGAVTLAAANSGLGNLTIHSSGQISVNQPTLVSSTAAVKLYTTANNANIVIKANIGGGSQVDVSVNGSGNLVEQSGRIIGDTVTLTSANGYIGDGAAPVLLTANNLSVHTLGLAYVSNSTSLNLLNSIVGNYFQVGTDTGTLTIPAGQTILTGTFTARGDSIDISGLVNANANSVTLMPNSGKSVGVLGGAGDLQLTSSTLSHIKASSLIIGDTSGTKDITIGSDIDVSGPGPYGVYDLSFYSAASVSNAGHTITLGNHALSIFTSLAGNGSVDTGTIIGGSSPISISSAGTLTASGNVTGTGIVTLNTSPNNTNVILQGNVGGGTGTFISANGSGSIIQSAGTTVSGTSVTLSSGTGNIGTVANPIVTSAATIKANTSQFGSGSVYVVDNAPGTVTIAPSGAGNTTGTFSLTAPSASSLTNSSSIQAHNVILNATSGTLDLTNPVVGTSAGTVSLTSGQDLTAATVSQVSANALNLTSINGGIGTVNSPATTTVSVLSLNAATSAYAENYGDLNLTGGIVGNAAGDTLSLIEHGNLTISGPLSGNNILINGLAYGASAGNIIATSSITGTGSNNNVSLTSAKDLTISNTATVAANNVNLTATTGQLNINGAVNGTNSGTVSLTSAADITDVSNVTTTALNLTSTAGSIGSSSSPLITTVSTLSLNAAASAYVTNTGDLNLTGAVVGNQPGDTLQLTENGNLTVTGPVSGNTILINVNSNGSATGTFTNNSSINGSGSGNSISITANDSITTNTNSSIAADTVSLTATNGSMTLNGDTTGTNNGSVTITAQNDINGTGQISGSTLTATSTAGSIGSSGAPIDTAVSNLSVQAANSAYFTNTGDLNLTGATVGNAQGDTFQLIENGDLSITGPVSGNTIIIQTNANGSSTGSINDNAPITSTGTGTGNSITLTAQNNFTSGPAAPIAGDTVDITATNGAIVLGSTVTGTNNGSVSLTSHDDITAAAVSQVNATTLALNSTAGNIGSSSSVVNTNASNLTLNAAGDAYVTDTQAVTLGTSTIGGQLNLTDPVSVTTGGNVTAGTVTITTPILVNPYVISANGASPGGTLTITSPNGSSLDISGGGTLSATGTVTVTSPTNNVQFSGTQYISAPTINVTAPSGAVIVVQPAQVYVNGSLTLQGNFIGDPSAIVIQSGQGVIQPVVSGSSFGTIANPNGDVVLNSNLLINTAGKNLVILAKGNVIGSSLGVINLSTSADQAGNLAVFAGFNFTPTPTGAMDTSTLFVVTGKSGTGGSINLANTQIMTNSFSSRATAKGGNVLMVATAGTANAGTIVTGGISTAAFAGTGGATTLIGEGGINVGGPISTNGQIAGGSINLSGAKLNIGGGFAVKNGYTPAITSFTALAPTAGSGAAITVSGPLNTSATTGLAGNINVASEAALNINASITSSGADSGSVRLSSLNGAVSVSGAITTAANSIFSNTSSTNGYAGGNVYISAPSSISVQGAITTNGGSTFGTGKGGAAGSITLTTAAIDVSNTAYKGNIYVAGSLAAAGGNANSGLGGAGGAISTSSGTLQVAGFAFANGSVGSVIASGGSGKAGHGTNGAINLTTSAVQQLPGNFDGTSKTANVYALAGGLFTIGAFPLINGTAGSIISGTDVASTTNAANTVSTRTIGNVTIGILQGKSSTITEGGQLHNYSAGTTNAQRKLVTPGEAMALYQVSLGGANAQSLGLNSFGQVVDTNSQNTASLLSVAQTDLPQFSVFNLTTASGAANGFHLDITGKTPVLNLTGAFQQDISGQITFSTAGANAIINAGGNPFTVKSGASVTSASALTLQGLGGAWTNKGTISAAAGIALLSPGGAVNFFNAGSLIGAAINIPSNGLPGSVMLGSTAGGGMLPISLNAYQVPTLFGNAAMTMNATSNGPGASTFIVNMPGQTATFSGTTSASALAALVIIGGTDAIAGNTSVSFASNSNIDVSQVLVVSTGGNAVIGSGANISSGSIVSINAMGLSATSASVSGKNGIFINTSSGLLSVTGSSLVSSLGPVILSANGATGAAIGNGSTIDGQFGVIINSLGALALGTAGPTASTTILNSNTGVVSINAADVLSINKTSITGKFGVFMTGKQFTDGGANSISTPTGFISLTGMSGLSIGAGTTISGAGGALLNSATGVMNLGAAGLTANLQAPSLILIASGLNMTNVSMTGTQSLNVIAGNGDITDTGNSTLKTAGFLSISGRNLSFGNGTAITNTSSSGIIVVSATGAAQLGSTGSPMIITSNMLQLNATGNITTEHLHLTATNAFVPVTLTSSSGQFIDNGGSQFVSASSFGINAKDIALGVTASSTISANSGIAINASAGNAAMSNGTSLSTATGSLNIAATGNVVVDANLTAGSLKPTAPSGPAGKLLDADVVKTGSISITAGTGATAAGITLGSNRSINAVGNSLVPGNITLTASGDILLGQNNTVRADGGDLAILTSANVSGGSGNILQSNGIANSSSSGSRAAGGGVEISAGSTTSHLPIAKQQPAGTTVSSSALGANVVITNNHGVVQTNLSGASTIDISHNSNNALVNLNGGVSVFSATKDKTIQLDGVTIQVSGYRPVAMTARASRSLALELEESDSETKDSAPAAHIFAEGNRGAKTLMLAGRSLKAHQRAAKITLLHGRMFINPLQAISIETAFGTVHAKAGSLLAVSITTDGLQVAVCSGPGDVSIESAQSQLQLLPGEECVISQGPSGSECFTADGVGRRNSIIRSLDSKNRLFISISEFSIIGLVGNAPHAQALAHPTGALEARITERLLKTAAVIQHITQSHGAYTARPDHNHRSSSNEVPVGYRSI